NQKVNESLFLLLLQHKIDEKQDAFLQARAERENQNLLSSYCNDPLFRIPLAHTHVLINCCKKNLRVPVRDNISKKIQDIVQECGKKNTLAGYYTLRQNISLEDYFTVQDSSCVLRVVCVK
ncbi:hypothetical protein RFI_37552, partial [Reticulomyxa filosa]